jgi:hypothetical protein
MPVCRPRRRLAPFPRAPDDGRSGHRPGDRQGPGHPTPRRVPSPGGFRGGRFGWGGGLGRAPAAWAQCLRRASPFHRIPSRRSSAMRRNCAAMNYCTLESGTRPGAFVNRKRPSTPYDLHLVEHPPHRGPACPPRGNPSPAAGLLRNRGSPYLSPMPPVPAPATSGKGVGSGGGPESGVGAAGERRQAVK